LTVISNYVSSFFSVHRFLELSREDHTEAAHKFTELSCPRGRRYKDCDRSMLNTIAICPEW
jgi:hypothetical protein